jgi:hypothetical protein
MQTLTGVTNKETVNDPAGFITVGAQVEVPFGSNETDIEVIVALMTDMPVVDTAVATLAGQVITRDCGRHECNLCPYIFHEILPIHAAIGNGRRSADGQAGGVACARQVDIQEALWEQ